MNYRGITLTDIAAKVYNALFLNRIKPETKKILRRKTERFSEKSIHNLNSYKLKKRISKTDKP